MPSARWAVTSQMKKSIKTLEKYQSKTAVRIILSLLFLTLAAVFVIVLLPLVPSSEEQLKGSIARLEYDTYYEVSIDGQVTAKGYPFSMMMGLKSSKFNLTYTYD